MATTKSLSSDDTLWATTFYGGDERGRCYTFTMIVNGLKCTRTFTEEELARLMYSPDAEHIIADDGLRPSFD